ncbi:acetyl-CoA synthetase [Pelistega indica]|uniref:Acetyl-CoA synthetase n=1 Tax=Pelistega indica TaxID=1414851 RepID=V8GB97_9BURK|nr:MULTISPECIES: AMP-binding protein [Pelistega]ETD73012.1 acetyl-CoA synthetase [Pelistega indica]
MSAKNLNQYASLFNTYEWYVPNNFNIANACCHRWADSPHEARQAAIYFEDQVGQLTSLSYGQLSERVNRLANGFMRMGIHPQDRIAIALQHSSETAITILAAITVGAIAVPLKAGLTNTEYDKRLIDCSAKFVIVDKHTIAPVTNAIDHNPILRQSLKQIIGINTEDERVIPWRTLLARQPNQFTAHTASVDTPAIMLYPDTPNDEPLKATLITHQALVGSLPGFVASQNWFPKKHDIFYTTFDWSTPLGLLGGLLPTLYFGRTIVGCPSGRTIPRLFTLLDHYPITNILTSSAELLRIKEYKDSLNEFELAVRCITCPDNEVTPELTDWVKNRFNASLNSICMPLGFSYIIAESTEKWPSQPGSMGMAIPGHLLAIIKENGERAATNEVGYLCVNAQDKNGDNDPALSLSFWSQAHIQSVAAFAQNWYNTGIRARLDSDGYFWRASHNPQMAD